MKRAEIRAREAALALAEQMKQMTATKPKGRSSFANMTPERRRELGAMGGRAVHALGKSKLWTSETARIAGRKGLDSRLNKPKGK